MEIRARLKKIKLFISDVDGVFTDGSFFINGELGEFKKFNALDGLGVKLLQNAGIPVAVISGRQSLATTERMTKLDIEDIIQGEVTKLEAYEKLKIKYGVSDDEIAYIGDDVIDVPLLRKVGLAVSVPNSVTEARENAHYITQKSGGDGALREVADMILKAQNKYYFALEKFTGIKY
ncbi:MAG: HAD hydrolase family protein [Candidatus Marinimicrobia bacterium]|nr:HAD hydrolase family protein [Candidatus Neomarinimicrobiota bacterium]